LVRTTLEHVKSRIKVQNNLSELSGTYMGSRQGNTLSCILFNMALEKVVRDSGIETKGIICNKTIPIIFRE
jgi:sorting nexin-29